MERRKVVGTPKSRAGGLGRRGTGLLGRSGALGKGGGGYDAYGLQSVGDRLMGTVQDKLRTEVDIATRLELLKTDALVWVVLLNADQGPYSSMGFASISVSPAHLLLPQMLFLEPSSLTTFPTRLLVSIVFEPTESTASY